MKTYNWSTAKGAVEITVSQSHKENEGQLEERTVTKMRIETFTMNGVSHIHPRVNYINGKNVIMFKLNGQQAGVVIPADIDADMDKETNERRELAAKGHEEWYAMQQSISRGHEDEAV